MKILMQTRSTLDQLNGGDKVQLESTAEAMRRLGHEVVISPGLVNDLRPYDVIHLFNMQIEPHSFMIYLLEAKAARKPVALSTIYWNPTQWKGNDDTPTGVRRTGITHKLGALFVYKFNGVPPARVLFWLLRSSDLRKWLWLALTKPSSGDGTHFIKQCLVREVDIILPNGNSEGDQVARDFAQPKQRLFVPNGVNDEFTAATGEAFKQRYKLTDFVLSVGRIESRKNVLALARATKELDLALVLIGNDTVEPDYTESVRQAAGAKLTIIREMPHDQLGEAYKAARVHALVSWFETPGLSSLEAALAGCTIVSTEIGTTKEYFAGMAYYCNPTDYRSIVSALKAAFAALKSDNLRQHILAHFTWDDAARATVRAYGMIGAR